MAAGKSVGRPFCEVGGTRQCGLDAPVARFDCRPGRGVGEDVELAVLCVRMNPDDRIRDAKGLSSWFCLAASPRDVAVVSSSALHERSVDAIGR